MSASNAREVLVDALGDLHLGGEEVEATGDAEPSPLRMKVRSSSRLSHPKRLDRRRAQARSSPEDLWSGNGHDVLEAGEGTKALRREQPGTEKDVLVGKSQQGPAVLVRHDPLECRLGTRCAVDQGQAHEQ